VNCAGTQHCKKGVTWATIHILLKIILILNLNWFSIGFCAHENSKGKEDHARVLVVELIDKVIVDTVLKALKWKIFEIKPKLN